MCLSETLTVLCSCYAHKNTKAADAAFFDVLETCVLITNLASKGLSYSYTPALCLPQKTFYYSISFAFLALSLR